MLKFTQSQSNFVFSDDRFIRLLAPAGCGKTSVLIEKARNIRKNNPKSRIMIFTFTRGAADELRDHCDKDVSISVSTLNSWGNDYIKLDTIKNAKIIKKHSDKLLCVKNVLQPVWERKVYEKTFKKILNSGQKDKKSEMIMDLIDGFKNIGFVHTAFDGKKEHDQEIYNKHIEYIKSVGLERYYNTMISDLIHTLGISEEDKHEAIVKTWIPFWKDCCEQMKATGFYTFDDQKYLANITLSEKVRNGEQWNGVTKMDYIFIDEFQDISPLDSMLITNLQKLNNAGLVIVGDDDQAIYEFRGASPYFILHPDEIFNQKFTTFILDENFRSPENIVTKATKLISYNINRVPKSVISSSKDKPAEITVNAYETQEEMVDAIIDKLKYIANETNETVAVLSRLKASLLPYQILLTKDDIKYDVSEDLAFFLTGAAKSLNTVMTIKEHNRASRQDLVELVSLACRNEMFQTAKNTLSSIFMLNNTKIETISEALEIAAQKYPKIFKIFNAEFIAKFEISIKKFFDAKNVYETLDCLLKNFDGLQQNYSRSLEDLYYRDPPLESLLDFASKYGDNYFDFNEDFNTAKEIANAALPEGKAHQRILLSTALRVKGQQFDNVIILNTINDTWPKKQATTNEEYEAERRLFYVATTRSKKSLSMYYSKIYHGEPTIISPFVHEGDYDK